MFDFYGAVRAMDAKALRSFLTTFGLSLPRDASEEFQLSLLEFAVRASKSVAFLSEDSELASDAQQWAKSARKSGEFVPAEMMALLRRTRRQVLAGRVEASRKVYELVIKTLLDLEFECEPESFAGSYLVTVYEQEDAHRISAMQAAVESLIELGGVSTPLALLEKAAIRPLVGFDAFLVDWAKATLEQAESSIGPANNSIVREAFERIEGTDGLARLARQSNDVGSYREWISRLTRAGQLHDALAAVAEGTSKLPDAFGRAMLHDLAVVLHARLDHGGEMVAAARDGLLADPNVQRLAVFAGINEPSAAELAVRLQSLGRIPFSRRMTALANALAGNKSALLEDLVGSDGDWDNDDHPTIICFSALAVSVSERRATKAVSARLGRVFGAVEGDAVNVALEWRGFKAPTAPGFELPTPDLAPLLARALRPANADDVVERVRSLRIAAATRTADVIRERKRDKFDQAAILLVVAAELTNQLKQVEVAKTFLSEVLVVTEEHPSFVSTLKRWLSQSPPLMALG